MIVFSIDGNGVAVTGAVVVAGAVGGGDGGAMLTRRSARIKCRLELNID
jgi:hypothetical protein